jgi:hypothetical protein
MSDTDILHTAQMLIDEFGVAAESQAAFRADKAFLQGSVEGEQIWKQVLAAIREIRSRES